VVLLTQFLIFSTILFGLYVHCIGLDILKLLAHSIRVCLSASDNFQPFNNSLHQANKFIGFNAQLSNALHNHSEICLSGSYPLSAIFDTNCWNTSSIHSSNDERACVSNHLPNISSIHLSATISLTSLFKFLVANSLIFFAVDVSTHHKNFSNPNSITVFNHHTTIPQFTALLYASS
jgi:hypothetical protein